MEEEEEEEAVSISVVNTNEDPPNAQEKEVVVFNRENRGGSAQHAPPTRSSHGPMKAQPCAIPIYISDVALSPSPCLRPAQWGELPDRCRSIGIIFRFVLTQGLAYCATVVMLCTW